MTSSPNSPGRKKKHILLVSLSHSKGNIWSLAEVASIVGKRSVTPPLGIITIAGLIPRETFALRFVDLNVARLSEADYQWADCLFVTDMFGSEDRDEVFGTAKRLGIPVVLGGGVIIEQYRDIDKGVHLVIGEAEGLMPQLIEDLLAGTLKRAYALPYSREMADDLRSYFGGDLFMLPVGQFPSPTEAPLPRFDLLDMGAYFMMGIQTTRGCPMNCDFCTIWPRFGRTPRTKPVSAVIAELDELYRLGWRDDVTLCDDNTFGDKAYFNRLLDALIPWQRRHNRVISFITQASLNIADDPELLKRMRAARMTTHFIGFESVEPEALREVNKSTNLAGNTRDRVIALQQHGMGIYAGVIVGFDSDPADVDRRIFRAFQDLGIQNLMLNLLMAPPGSVVYKRLDAEARINRTLRPSSWMPFISNIFSNRPLQEVMLSYRRTLTALYPGNMKPFFERCATYYERLCGANLEPPMKTLARLAPDVEPLPRDKGFCGTTGVSLPAALKLAVHHIFSPSFPHLLRFLWRVKRRWPEHLNSAFISTVLGTHFQNITQSYCEAAEVWEFLFARLAALNNSLGQEFATPTEMAGDLVPQRYFIKMPDIPPRAATPVPPKEAEALGDAALREAESRYGGLSKTAKELLRGDYSRFRNDVAACVARRR